MIKLNPLFRLRDTFRSGFTLVEVTLSLGIASFAMVAIYGLLPVGINNNQAAFSQSAAASIASGIVSDLRVSGTSNISKVFGFNIPQGGSSQSIGPQTLYFDESLSVSGSVGSAPLKSGSSTPLYRVSVYFGTYPGRASTLARIFITWPALADQDPKIAAQHYAGAFETVTTLDRN